jgi:hypothetical protein
MQVVYKAASTFGETAAALQSALARLGVRSQAFWAAADVEMTDRSWLEHFDNPSNLFIVLGSQLFTHLPRR